MGGSLHEFIERGGGDAVSEKLRRLLVDWLIGRGGGDVVSDGRMKVHQVDDAVIYFRRDAGRFDSD